MLLPPLLHLPIFIGTTLTIRDACTRSFVALQNSVHAVESESVRTIDDTMSALALESLAWCPSLSDVDPYIVLPVAVGVTALLNVEVQARIRQSLAELRENIVDSPETSTSSAQRMESSDRHPEMPAMPSRIMSTRTARPAPSIPSVLRKKTFVTTSKTAQTPVSAISPKSSASFKEAGSNNASVGAVARSRAITNVLRFGSILFIPIAAASPVVSWPKSGPFQYFDVG